jgi:hypothetical protein
MTKKFFGQDLLSPLVGAAAFPDFFQLLTFNALPTSNRARAFERSLERAWDKIEASDEMKAARGGAKSRGETQNPFKLGFLSHWAADGAAPALLLNTTEVFSGTRYVIAPIRNGDNPFNFHQKVFSTQSVRETIQGQFVEFPSVANDVSLSAAVALSSAFPWILPASVVESEKVCVFQNPRAKARTKCYPRFADGGYFESSGAQVINEIIASRTDLGELLKKWNVDLRTIVIRNFEPGEPPPPYKSHEWWIPVETMLETRNARGTDAHERFAKSLCPSGDLRCYAYDFNFEGGKFIFRQYKKLQGLMWTQNLGTGTFLYPLGWRLSSQTLERIANTVGDTKDCKCELRDGQVVTQAAEQRGEFDGTLAKGCGLAYGQMALDLGREGMLSDGSQVRWCSVTK